ncbi:uncharacterized protein LOC133466802 [Phyllopteryx taeniolatus]|uniref:uncharacterized protein LOC133466802 n=1 Tax=Phyllopteryx taeniolatus TaxID=161469 RepID=UPI002AD2F9A7|nr:uncharacterized protein LOC133466802 [Phyllopteryx taeniolatus]
MASPWTPPKCLPPSSACHPYLPSSNSDFSDCEDGPDLVNLLSDSESDTDLDFSGSFPSLSRPRQFLSRLPVSNPSESKSFPSDLFLGTRLAIYLGPPRGGQRRRPSKGQILPPRCFSPVHKSLNFSPVPTHCSTTPIKSRLVKPAPKPPCSVPAIFPSSPSRDLVHSSTPVPSTPKPQWRQAEEATAGPVPAPRQLRQAPVPAPRQLRQAPVPAPRQLRQAPVPAPRQLRQAPAPAALVQRAQPVPAPAALVQRPPPVPAPAALVQRPPPVLAPAALVQRPPPVLAPAALVQVIVFLQI